MAEFNNAYVAHIVASSVEGPRGDKTLSPLLSDKLENLMLMCADHHKLIDNPTTGPRDYPVERLKDMKKRMKKKSRKFVVYLMSRRRKLYAFHLQSKVLQMLTLIIN